MSSESGRLGPLSAPKIVLVKIFLIEIAISSKNPPTPEWLGVPKMHLTGSTATRKKPKNGKKPWYEKVQEKKPKNGKKLKKTEN